MPDADPHELFYPVSLKDYLEAKERDELRGDPNSPALFREQARLAAGRRAKDESEG